MSDQNPGAPQIIAFFSLLFMAAALWFTIPSFQSIKTIYDSRLWPEVKGRIVVSEVELRRPDKGDVAGQGYRPRVLASYVVGGKDHLSRQFRLGRDFVQKRSLVEKRLAEYPLGGEVVLRSSPRSPEKILVLSEDKPVWDALRVALGALVFAGGMAHLIGAFRREE